MWIADVAGVEDVVDVRGAEGGEDFGAEEAVGVGEDAEGESGRQGFRDKTGFRGLGFRTHERGVF